MDIKELRVGNIVRLKDHFVGGNVMVTGIMKDKLTAVNSVGTNIGTINIMYLEPIPITEEILLKIGFNKGQGNGYASYKINPYDGHIIEVAIYESGIDVFIQYICGACHLRTIKHLHELQNIVFAITGKELEVEL